MVALCCSAQLGYFSSDESTLSIRLYIHDFYSLSYYTVCVASRMTYFNLKKRLRFTLNIKAGMTSCTNMGNLPTIIIISLSKILKNDTLDSLIVLTASLLMVELLEGIYLISMSYADSIAPPHHPPV